MYTNTYTLEVVFFPLTYIDVIHAWSIATLNASLVVAMKCSKMKQGRHDKALQPRSATYGMSNRDSSALLRRFSRKSVCYIMFEKDKKLLEMYNYDKLYIELLNYKIKIEIPQNLKK